MKPLVSRAIGARWDAPPDLVAATIGRAIAEQRHGDAGHPEWALWLIRGSIIGRRLDLRLTPHSEAGSRNFYNYAVVVRGDLMPAGDGTQLVAQASALGTAWEVPVAVAVAVAVTLLVLLTGHIVEGAPVLVLSYGVLLVWILLMHALASAIAGPVAQIEAVIECAGRPPAEPAPA